MKSLIKSMIRMSALSAMTLSALVGLSAAASAQTVGANGLNGSYLGGGVSVGVTNGDRADGDNVFGGNIEGRYDIPEAPISLRGAALINGESAALMPILSYDVAVSRNTNLYAGAGYSFVTEEGQLSPLGDQSAVVLTTGLESEVSNRVVLYGDVKLGLDAYQDSSDAAVSLQLGAGYRF